MSEREAIVKQMDALVDTYHGGGLDVSRLLEVRRDLAVHLYRLSAFVKDVHGQAGLSYMRRRWSVAKEVVAARNADKKEALGLSEARAETLANTVEHREREVWAEAEREALKSKIDLAKQVLASMQQEIAHAAHELKTTHFQDAQR